MIIDAHLHLWKKQQGLVNNKPVFSIGNGKSMFGDEVRQMMPPYFINGENTAEILLSNMDYAGVSACVVTQEEIDGNQDEYLLTVKQRYNERFKICSLYEENKPINIKGFDGIKLCSSRFYEKDLTKHFDVFKLANDNSKFVSIDLADGDTQTSQLNEIIQQLPNLKIAIGHFGMVTRKNWQEQIKLARNNNVFIESGGITWLFNNEFYPFKGAIKAINEAADICSFDKIMWGSDYPRTMTAITYKMSYDFVTKSVEISEENKQKFLCKNAMEFYGFKNLHEIELIKNMVED